MCGKIGSLCCICNEFVLNEWNENTSHFFFFLGNILVKAFICIREIYGIFGVSIVQCETNYMQRFARNEINIHDFSFSCNVISMNL